jgi:hypothetical protein
MAEREPKPEKHDGIAYPPPPLPLPRKEEVDEDSDGPKETAEVEFGFRGRWYPKTVYFRATEEEMNAIASSIFQR